ncbi:MAG TPA: hypothetical protein VFZ66_23540 [Herpetosiphonaceae bacterium]
MLQHLITWKQAVVSAVIVFLVGAALIIPARYVFADTTCEHYDHGHFPGTSGKNERYIYWEQWYVSTYHYHKYWHEYTDLTHGDWHTRVC